MESPFQSVLGRTFFVSFIKKGGGNRIDGKGGLGQRDCRVGRREEDRHCEILLVVLCADESS